MKKKVLTTTIIVSVITSILCLIFIATGTYENKQYAENTILCNAVIVDIKTENLYDSNDDYLHKYYGTYTANGTTYTNIEVSSDRTNASNPTRAIGQTMQIKVLQNDPTKLAEDGTTSFVMAAASFGCTVLVVIIGVYIYKHIKEPQKTVQ